MSEPTNPLEEVINRIDHAKHLSTENEAVDALDAMQEVLEEANDRYVFDDDVDAVYQMMLEYGPEPFDHDQKTRCLQNYEQMDVLVTMMEADLFREKAIYEAGKYGLDPALVDWMGDVAAVSDGLTEFMAVIKERWNDNEACCDLAQKSREERAGDDPHEGLTIPENLPDEEQLAEDIMEAVDEELKAENDDTEELYKVMRQTDKIILTAESFEGALQKAMRLDDDEFYTRWGFIYDVEPHDGSDRKRFRITEDYALQELPIPTDDPAESGEASSVDDTAYEFI